MKIKKLIPLIFIAPLLMSCTTNLSEAQTLDLAAKIKEEISLRPIKNEHLLFLDSKYTNGPMTTHTATHFDFKNYYCSGSLEFSDTSLNVTQNITSYSWIDVASNTIYSADEVKDAKTYIKTTYESFDLAHAAWLTHINMPDGINSRRQASINSANMIKVYIDQMHQYEKEPKIIASSSNSGSLNFKATIKGEDEDKVVGIVIKDYLLCESNTTIQQKDTILNELKLKFSSQAKPIKLKLDKSWKEVSNG